MIHGMAAGRSTAICCIAQKQKPKSRRVYIVATKKGPLKVSLSKERETKGTWRYAEEEEDRDKQVIGKLYLKKGIVDKLGDPDDITVTVAAG
jgi:hypothetical protein